MRIRNSSVLSLRSLLTHKLFNDTDPIADATYRLMLCMIMNDGKVRILNFPSFRWLQKSRKIPVLPQASPVS
jgi:hypothetical protein